MQNLNENQINILATTFANSLVEAKRAAEVNESNNQLSFKATEFKSKQVSIPVGDLFKFTDRPFKDASKLISVQQWPLAPAGLPINDEEYFFRLDLLQDLIVFMKEPTDFGVWLAGGKGTGKTSVIEQICSRLGKEVFQETGSAKTEYFDLFGMHVPVGGGKTRFMSGGLLSAMRQGGVFVLNEADAMLPSEQIKLNEIIGGKMTYIPQLEEWIVPHQDFRFVATGNTNGTGDETGNFSGTQKMNDAFMDRFFVHKVEALPKHVEVEILKKSLYSYAKKRGLDKDPSYQKLLKTYEAFCIEMVEVATKIRSAADSQSGASSKMSIRGLKRWLNLVLSNTKTEGMNTLKSGFMKAYANGLSDAERITALELCNDVFGDQFSTTN